MIHRQTTERERGEREICILACVCPYSTCTCQFQMTTGRVKLSLDHEGSDFINANYVPVSKVIDRHVTSRTVLDVKPHFITSQHPDISLKENDSHQITVTISGNAQDSEYRVIAIVMIDISVGLTATLEIPGMCLLPELLWFMLMSRWHRFKLVSR